MSDSPENIFKSIELPIGPEQMRAEYRNAMRLLNGGGEQATEIAKTTAKLLDLVHEAAEGSDILAPCLLAAIMANIAYGVDEEAERVSGGRYMGATVAAVLIMHHWVADSVRASSIAVGHA